MWRKIISMCMFLKFLNLIQAQENSLENVNNCNRLDIATMRKFLLSEADLSFCLIIGEFRKSLPATI